VLGALVAVVVVKGTVTIGPLTPVCRVGVPCDGPAPKVVLTFTSGTRVVHATTGAVGGYTVKLAPGTYTVTASKGMRIAPDTVTARGVALRRNFAIDTGIR
jgi:hypothetical protein